MSKRDCGQGPDQEMLSLLHYLTIIVPTAHVILALASVATTREYFNLTLTRRVRPTWNNA